MDKNLTEKMSASAPLSPMILSGAEPRQIALLFATTAIFTLFYALITVAIYRVSKHLHPFIFFLSEAIANMQLLALATVCYGGQLFHSHPLGDDVTEYVLVSLCSYVSQLHYLLIAVNRAFAVLFPLEYDLWWSRERVVVSVALVWVIGGGLELINIMQYLATHRVPLWTLIYIYVQRCVTLPSLALYSVALCWVLVGRLLMCFKRHRARVGPGELAANSFATNSTNYAHVIDLSIFAYCFISFLPNFYNLLIRPPLNSLHYQYYAAIRVASPCLLLYAMSSTAREELPGSQLFQKAWERLFRRRSQTSAAPARGTRVGRANSNQAGPNSTKAPLQNKQLPRNKH